MKIFHLANFPLDNVRRFTLLLRSLNEAERGILFYKDKCREKNPEKIHSPFIVVGETVELGRL
jgi:hypothetical protein